MMALHYSHTPAKCVHSAAYMRHTVVWVCHLAMQAKLGYQQLYMILGVADQVFDL